MIACAQCGKKNKDNATVCKYCGYNPGALQANTMSWGYQNGGYVQMPYQPPMQQGAQYYYDANGKAYSVRYDYKVTPVEDDDEDDEDDGEQQMTLYPYNPMTTQQSFPQAMPQQMMYQMPQQSIQPMLQQDEKIDRSNNIVAWIGYILALFLDILAWPICFLGLFIANRRDDANKDLCIGGMLFTLLRVLSVAVLFLIWWAVNTYFPAFFVGAEKWKVAFVKMVLFGWPVAIGSIFAELSPDGSGAKAAGKGFFFLSLAIALAGLVFFDINWLPIFS